MPILKQPKKREPPWKDWDKDAQKEGIRAPVYAVNGNTYTGEWSNNLKHGMLNCVSWWYWYILFEASSVIRLQAKVPKFGARQVLSMRVTGNVDKDMVLVHSI